MRDVLFFSRGRGRGHVIPDIALTKALSKLAPDINVRFVSYGTGAATLKEAQYPVIDLGLPDANPLFKTLVEVMRTVMSIKSVAVVSHEELVPLAAAKADNRPTVLITDFFFPSGNFLNEALEFADHILFLQRPGLFPEPEVAKGKVEYLGPLVRSLAYSRADKLRARSELQIGAEAVVLSVMPGAWANEKRAPLADALVPVFDELPMRKKYMFWIAGADVVELTSRYGTREDLILFGSYWPLERLMVASDVIITKCNRVTVIEAASLGVPTLSIAYGHNPVDELIVRDLPWSRVICRGGNESRVLQSCIMACLSLNHGNGRLEVTTPEKVGTILRDHIYSVADVSGTV